MTMFGCPIAVLGTSRPAPLMSQKKSHSRTVTPTASRVRPVAAVATARKQWIERAVLDHEVVDRRVGAGVKQDRDGGRVRRRLRARVLEMSVRDSEVVRQVPGEPEVGVFDVG